MNSDKQIATFAGGCFWCTEAVFQRVEGVIKATPGYTGGHVENPTYEQVTTGETGHAEAIQIEFDPKIVTFEYLLKIHFVTHDPTTLNQQGNDIGPQYRSAVFYHDDNQLEITDNYIKNLRESKKHTKPIVTEVKKFEKFYEAEDYHKNYYNNNMDKPYCMIVIEPKLEKLEKILG